MFKKHNLLLILAFFICIVLSCEYHTNPPVIIPGEPNSIGAKNISYNDPYSQEQGAMTWTNDGQYLIYEVENLDYSYYSYYYKPVIKNILTQSLYPVYYGGYSANWNICVDQNGYLYYGGNPDGGFLKICKDTGHLETEPILLTYSWAISCNPQISPDYSQITFSSQRESADHSDIYLMGIDGELEGDPAKKISNSGYAQYTDGPLFTNNGGGIIYYVNCYLKRWYYYDLDTNVTKIFNFEHNLYPLQWLGSGDLFLVIDVDRETQGKFPLGYIDLADCIFHPLFPDATCFPDTIAATLSPNHHTLAFISEVNDAGDRDVFLVEVEVPPLN
jgi:hypothetical protein